ncbi:MAG TPA: TlyA family RNA methyltransferase [Candidatus Binataceae bacterium]|nr:TlyA family RNA methyltransferase [Candidatus Binataceae bacterium]
MRARLDIEMARRGLADSREAAQRLIMAGRVRVNSRPADKADLRVSPDTEIEIVGSDPEYASRGAYKLIGALDRFSIEVAGRHALDVGASTGGFTDVLLKRGAARVIALDVGYGQLAERLRTDSRVTVMDRTNIRLVRPGDLPYQPDLVTIDTSFISLRIVLPAVVALLAPKADIVALVKPQFEVGKGKVGKGGIVRDEALRREALEGILDFARSAGFEIIGSMDSPIEGAKGNREFLVAMRAHRA